MLDAVRVDDAAECGRVAVGERVVADDALNPHFEARIERDGPFQHTGGSGAFLVVMDLGVGDRDWSSMTVWT